jgi:hypothetical protein
VVDNKRERKKKKMNKFYNTDILKKEGVKMLELISELYLE